MTTSDKITHAFDVVFLIGIIVLVYFFMKADRQHDQEIQSLQATVQQLHGKVTTLEGKGGTPEAAQPPKP